MNKSTYVASAVLFSGVALGMGIQRLFSSDESAVLNTNAPSTNSASRAPEPTAPVVIDTSNMQEALRSEIAARKQLAEQVARLEHDLKALRSEPRGSNGNSNAATSAAAAESTPKDLPHERENSAFDEQSLRDAGMSATEAAQVRERFEQLEMDRLVLRDRAQREGWMGTVRYSNEVARLEDKRQDIRANMGDNSYDAYLYASGQDNRVVVRDVLQGSPAKQVGIVAGDTIVRYADKRIFNQRDLQTATSEGKLGEMTRVDIERDGRSLDLYVPRGPLGIYMDSESRKPN